MWAAVAAAQAAGLPRPKRHHPERARAAHFAKLDIVRLATTHPVTMPALVGRSVLLIFPVRSQTAMGIPWLSILTSPAPAFIILHQCSFLLPTSHLPGGRSLDDNSLSGTIPSELGLLTKLTSRLCVTDLPQSTAIRAQPSQPRTICLRACVRAA